MTDPTVPMQKSHSVTVLERLDRIDHYCNELEGMVFETSGDETDEDITGQIERSIAGLELLDVPHLRIASK